VFIEVENYFDYEAEAAEWDIWISEFEERNSRLDAVIRLLEADGAVADDGLRRDGAAFTLGIISEDELMRRTRERYPALQG
jgi:hypothetical protein